MANALITPTIIAREALAQLDNNLVVAKTVYRDYDREYRKNGDTVNVRRPVNFTVTDGAVASVQDVEEANFALQMNSQKHVAWKFSSKDLTLTIDEYSERYIKPAMIQLANKVDMDLLGLYSQVNNWVGTAGQDINSFADFAKGPERLDTLAVPSDSRFAVLSPADYWAMVGSQTSLSSSDRLVESAYERSRLGRIGGVEVLMAQNVRTHTGGTRAASSASQVNGNGQISTYAAVKTNMTQTLLIKNMTAGHTIAVGDVFTIANVKDVNPVTGETLPHDKMFTVTATAGAADGGGLASVTIYPAIITSGPYKTVNAAPVDSAAITYVGTASVGYRQNMVYHKNAFALVTAPLYLPDGASFKAQASDPSSGMSVTIVKDFDFINYEERIRLDILYGVKAIDPRLATRLSGT
jgi:hypothetical protein